MVDGGAEMLEADLYSFNSTRYYCDNRTTFHLNHVNFQDTVDIEAVQIPDTVDAVLAARMPGTNAAEVNGKPANRYAISGDGPDVRKEVNGIDASDVRNTVKDIDSTDISDGKYSLFGEISDGDGKAYERFLKDGPQEGLTQAEIIGIYKADRQAALNAISQNAVSGKGVEGGGYSDAVFASEDKLVSHFDKHGDEFKGLYNSVDEYLQGARDVMNNGYKVEYSYKGETRMGFVQFMGNNSKGKAKFAFVGTNNEGYITTFHTESGKTFWKLLNNGENIPVINPK